MEYLNLDILTKNSIEYIIKNVSYIFKSLIREIESYLNLDILDQDINLVFCKDSISMDNQDNPNLSFGIYKTEKNGKKLIKILENYKEYIRIILLREAYKCFIPDNLKHNEIVNIFINQKVLIDLNKFPESIEWKNNYILKDINSEFISAELDRLQKFLKRESNEKNESPFLFFFQYLRRYYQIIDNTKMEFYNNLFREYTLKTAKSLNNNEIIETLRVIINIFYKVKSYRALLDYQTYFKEFISDNTIKTDLSLRKFTENMRWIKEFSDIAPSYQINWKTLNICSLILTLRFNPSINTSKIREILKIFPFSISPKISKCDFGYEVLGYIIVPRNYYNDIINFIKKLEESGYIISKKCLNLNRGTIFLNLNYFREGFNKNSLINHSHPAYDKKCEIEFTIDYGAKHYKPQISLLEWLILDRIRYFSITGFGFERRNETLGTLKSDLINNVIVEQNLIQELKRNLNFTEISKSSKENILVFLSKNQKIGFFHIKKNLSEILGLIKLINNILNNNPNITSITQLKDYNKKKFISNSIEENLLINNKFIKKIIFSELIPLYFKSKKEYFDKIQEYLNFYEILKSFYNLKIFNINKIQQIIKQSSLINKIFKIKEDKLEKYSKSFKAYKITNALVENILEDFLNNKPPIIVPNLIGTIKTEVNYFCFLIIKSNSTTLQNLEKIKFLFPRLIAIEGLDVYNQEKVIYLELFIPSITKKEKLILFSYIYTLFKQNIIFFKRYLWSGFTEAFSRKDFYDLSKKKFFYTKDLFQEYFLFIKSFLGVIPSFYNEPLDVVTNMTWFEEKTNSDLLIAPKIEFKMPKISELNRLLDYHINLRNLLLEDSKFIKFKDNNAFENYIKSIIFIPSFQHFGLSQYFLYFKSIKLDEINFNHLLTNTFLSFKHHLSIDRSNAFLIDFIWPYRNPNTALINWLTKSKKNIREYCLFFVKKIFQILHFNYNVVAQNWDLNPNRFRVYFQNILFNPDYEIQTPKIKEFNIGDLNISNYFTPESAEFEALSHIYNYKPLDIKSYLGTRKSSTVNQIIDLLEKRLIFPYISLKNLALIEKLYIILPNLKKEHNNTILKICSFFNIGFVYEIEGEYYIYGFEKEIKYENGLMIILYLPNCQLDEFIKLFDLIFQYLEIDHYVILNDMVNGKKLLKSIYRNLDFLNNYNPLINLIWNDKDKIWMNHKLFNEKFEPIYPDLFYGSKKFKVS